MFHHIDLGNIALGAVGVYLIVLGLRGIRTKKPFVTSTLQFLWIFLIMFVPPLLADGGLFFSAHDYPFDFMYLFLFVVIGVLFFVFWQNRGYSVWGATDEYLQDALHSTLKKLDLPYEETVARLRLVSLDADLTVSSPGLGIAYIRVKQRRHASTLKQIAQHLSEYFASAPGKVSLSIFYIYALLGALVLMQTILMLTRSR